MAYSTEERRWEIIHTFKRLKGIRAVARALEISRSTVQLWVRRYQSTGGVDFKPKSGRKHVLSPSSAEAALGMLLDEQHGTAYQVAQQLQLQGHTSVRVHRTSVVRAARMAAMSKGKCLRAVRGQPAKRLTEATKTKRRGFTRVNRSTTWGYVMFTDRKRFLFRYPGTRVRPVKWLMQGEEHLAMAVNHPQCLNVYAGITRYGVTKMHVVAGSSKHTTTFKNKNGQPAKNITSAEYQHVLNATLLPEGRRIFSTQGISSWVLQQDNDPAHKEAPQHVQQWNTQHNSSISVLADWPPNSPDLNPIENVWAYVQSRVDQRGCKTFEEFKQAVLDEFQAVPVSMLRNLFDSMPRRMAKVTQLGGDKSGY